MNNDKRYLIHVGIHYPLPYDSKISRAENIINIKKVCGLYGGPEETSLMKGSRLLISFVMLFLIATCWLKLCIFSNEI